MSGSSIDELLRVVAALREPETGCPWDLKQTHRSLIPFLVEESYEVIDSIENGSSDDFREELGDLLFQVVLHSQLKKEEGEFTFDDVADSISSKLIRRHPHVFSDTIYATEAEQQQAWDLFKQEERARKENVVETAAPSVLDGVAQALPALMRAHQLQKRASRVGFDWNAPEPTFAKVEEELAEVREVLELEESHERRVEEVGDLLFAVVNLSRHLGVNAEEALRLGSQKFDRRFRSVEAKAVDADIATEEAGLEQLEKWWDEAKLAEKNST